MANGQILGELERLGFPDIMLWLLTFAVIFGILSQTKMPASKAARGIISISIAFLVMLTAPAELIVFLSQASSGLVLIVVAILLLISFIEAAGIKTTITVPRQDKEGNIIEGKMQTTIFKKYSTVFTIAFVIIAILIFLGSGGWELLGWDISIRDMGSQSMTGIIFITAVIIGVLWMIVGSKS